MMGTPTLPAIPAETGKDDGHGQAIGKLEAGFFYEGDRPKRWGQRDDIWVHGFWSWDWATRYEQVATLDTEKRLLVLRPPYGLYGSVPVSASTS